jgi:hypothetical protein
MSNNRNGSSPVALLLNNPRSSLSPLSSNKNANNIAAAPNKAGSGKISSLIPVSKTPDQESRAKKPFYLVESFDPLKATV